MSVSTLKIDRALLTPRVIKRIMSRIDFDGPGGCWLWTGSRNKWGYGKTTIYYKTYGAHRVVYSILVGEIPDGMQLDHVAARGCRHRHCVNPTHLEPVTAKVNTSRRAPRSASPPRAHCPAGHAMRGKNVYRHPNGSRVCRRCRAQHNRDYRERQRAS